MAVTRTSMASRSLRPNWWQSDHQVQNDIGSRSGDREVVLGPSGYITKPRGELHTMWNAGAVPARMIEVISPAGSEHFFRELSELLADGQPLAPDARPALAAHYGLQLQRPAWLPDLIERYGLRPPPG